MVTVWSRKIRGISVDFPVEIPVELMSFFLYRRETIFNKKIAFFRWCKYEVQKSVPEFFRGFSSGFSSGIDEFLLIKRKTFF